MVSLCPAKHILWMVLPGRLKLVQEIAGHKLSDSVLDRLPTLCTMNPGKKISYSEVIAFHNSGYSHSEATCELMISPSHSR